MNSIPLAKAIVQPASQLMNDCMQQHQFELRPLEVGTVTSVERGVIQIAGLPGVRIDEMLRLPGGARAVAFKLDRDGVGAILLDDAARIHAGDEVQRERRQLDIPVAESLLGRVVDPLGRPLDRQGAISAAERRPVEAEAPQILDRLPVTVPLQTGIKAIDALIPVGRGQRQLIIGDRQTGKTSIAVDTILNQKNNGVICVYCAVGQRNTAVAEVINDLHRFGAMDYSVVVAAESDAAPGLQFVAPFAAMSIGEFFMQRGHDVLLVMDDLTAHARAYRQLSLLLRRPPGREAFPGDIFYLHSRLLERSTHLCDRCGGGSLTTLAVAETNAGNLADYIPTNLISITDGQICLSSDLFQLGQLPAIDIGRSVSRVGGKTQNPSYRSVAADLRLSYTQFQELETFSRFSSRLDPATQATLEQGRRVREVLKQPRYRTLSVQSQIASLLAVTQGLLDDMEINQLPDFVSQLEQAVPQMATEAFQPIASSEKLTPAEQESIEEQLNNWITQNSPTQTKPAGVDQP